MKRRRLRFLSRFEFSGFQLALKLCRFEDGGRSPQKPNHFTLLFFGLWIRLWSTASEVKDDMLDSWGFSYGEFRCVHLNWRERCKIIHFPWALDHYKTEVLVGDPRGSKYVEWDQWKRVTPEMVERSRETGKPLDLENPPPADMVTAEAMFRYQMKSGEVQWTKATVTKVERMTWVWRCAKWRYVGWLLRRITPKKVRESIDVSFADELGSERGSWKGGVIGTGHDRRRGEHPLDALKRMSLESDGRWCRG